MKYKVLRMDTIDRMEKEINRLAKKKWILMWPVARIKWPSLFEYIATMSKKRK